MKIQFTFLMLLICLILPSTGKAVADKYKISTLERDQLRGIAEKEFQDYNPSLVFKKKPKRQKKRKAFWIFLFSIAGFSLGLIGMAGIIIGSIKIALIFGGIGYIIGGIAVKRIRSAPELKKWKWLVTLGLLFTGCIISIGMITFILSRLGH